MSQKGKFSAPFKSPAARSIVEVTSLENGTSESEKASYFVSPWREESTTDGPNEVKTVKKIKSPSWKKKKEYGHKKALLSAQAPKTPPRTPVFQLYGVKSPYRRKHSTGHTPGASRFSFMSSQASSPGISPARIINNFSEKMKPRESCVDENMECDEGDTVSEPGAKTEHLIGTETNNTTSVNIQQAHQPSPELAVVMAKKNKPVVNDVYDIELSLEPVKKSVKKKTNKKRQQIKQVLAVIRKMHKDFVHYQQQYDSMVNKKATKVAEMVSESSIVPVTSMELVYSYTQSQTVNTQIDGASLSSTAELRPLYSEAVILPLNKLTQGESEITDPTEE